MNPLIEKLSIFQKLFGFGVRKYILIFKHKIIIQKVPKKLYNDKSFTSSVENLFYSSAVLKYGVNSFEQNGLAYSTCALDNEIIYNIENINPLLEYIKEIILEVNNEKQQKYKKVIFHRVWANKIFKNCSGKCHCHDGPFDGTAIFYFKVPKKGSKLIILKHFIEGIVEKPQKNLSKYITVKSGDLLLHDKEVFHAVSKHMSDTPRICFVFDYKIE